MTQADRSHGPPADLVCRVGFDRDEFALDVDLVVAADETVGLIGPNGAGKTTLLRIIGGLEQPDRGVVMLQGATLVDPDNGIDVAPEHRSVAMSFNTARLFPRKTARQNVEFALEQAHSGGRTKSDRSRQAGEWLDRVGLSAKVDEKVETLSGGMAQRVSLARTLAADRRLLLLDEPLSALDLKTRTLIRSLLIEHLAHRTGPTIIVTHDPVDATVLADRLVVIDEGQVVQDGSPTELTAQPASAWVARFVDHTVWRGDASGTEVAVGEGRVVVADPINGPVVVGVPARAVTLHQREPEGSARNIWPLTVQTVHRIDERVRVALAGDVELVAEVTHASAAALTLEPGRPVWASVKATELLVRPR
ncbi:MAG: ABC transporter ATP-binding protein [Actinomycetia bacterium]|nr:ABC transporter ATP-binding protein [Actinomycetes bacterium]